MVTNRTYGDPCGIARALDHIGERWALLIVRELVLGPKRFTDLRSGLPNLSPDVLTQRLNELEQAGITRRRKLPPPAASRVYELTERGHDLEPAILALGRWGSRAPFPPGKGRLGIDALILALRTLYDPATAGSLSASYELHFGEHTFRADVADGRLDLVRGSAEHPDATIDTDPGTLAAVLWHGRDLVKAEHSGKLDIAGSRRAFARFLNLFPAPVPAEMGTG